MFIGFQKNIWRDIHLEYEIEKKHLNIKKSWCMLRDS